MSISFMRGASSPRSRGAHPALIRAECRQTAGLREPGACGRHRPRRLPRAPRDAAGAAHRGRVPPRPRAARGVAAGAGRPDDDRGARALARRDASRGRRRLDGRATDRRSALLLPASDAARRARGQPAAALQLPRRARTLPRTLSPAEAERLIDAANGTTPRAMRDRALVELMYGAGLRVSEATGLHRRSVDLDDRLVRATRQGVEGAPRPARPAGGRRAAPLHLDGSAAPRLPQPAGALPERPRRAAHARRRLPHPAPPRREGRARATASPPASAPALLRDAPARGRRRPAQRPGDARPRRSVDHRALHTRIRSAASGVVLPSAPSRAKTYDFAKDVPR